MATRKKRPRKFHHFIFAFLKKIVRPIMLIKMGFRPRMARLTSQPSLIYANHPCDADAVFVGLGIKAHMYFVSSSHIVHKGWGPLIMRLVDPILRIKGRTDAEATMDILRRLRAGDNVCIFIEGERSYDGLTGYIAPTAAHLAKISGVPLVTYRLTGGYLTQPRWASSTRKGYLTGEIVGEYSAAELKAIDKEQLQRLIEDDLHVDAYAIQEQKHSAYKGKNLAEHLETTLFFCPVCGQIAALHSEDDRFYCSCGLDLRFNTYGYFENIGQTAMPFTTVRDWFAWQKEKIEELSAQAQNNNAVDFPLLSDVEQEFYLYGVSEESSHARGSLALYIDRLELGFEGKQIETIPLEQVKSFACLQQMLITLTLADGRFYEISSPYPRAAIKYQLCFDFLKKTTK